MLKDVSDGIETMRNRRCGASFLLYAIVLLATVVWSLPSSCTSFVVVEPPVPANNNEARRVFIGTTNTNRPRYARMLAQNLSSQQLILEPGLLHAEEEEEAVEEAQQVTSFSLRRARPDEIDSLAVLVSECFYDDDDESIGTLTLLHQKWDRFVTRWTVYAGMVQRLVISNYKEGLAQGRSSGMVDSDVHQQSLFVACLLTMNINTTVIGVAELVQDEDGSLCPIPFDLERQSPRKASLVCNLAVRPEYRQMGVGRALFRHVEQEATTTSDEVWLETNSQNVAALRLYASEAYVCEGIDPQVRFPRQRVLLRKRLNDNAPEYRNNLLYFKQDDNNNWNAVYNLTQEGEHKQQQHIRKESFLEQKFGTLAPIVAALGTIVGIILF